jgi:hypothetical protein
VLEAPSAGPPTWARSMSRALESTGHVILYSAGESSVRAREAGTRDSCVTRLQYSALNGPRSNQRSSNVQTDQALAEDERKPTSGA